MVQKIDYKVHVIADEFSSDVWAFNNMQSSYISMRPRNDFVMLGGGVLMWGIILVGYVLVSLPYIISIPLVVVSYMFYRYFSLSSRQRDGFIQFRQYNDELICIGAHGLDRTRIKHLSAKHNMNVVFEKSYGHEIRFSSRRYDRRGY